jgi:hypothetical protein
LVSQFKGRTQSEGVENRVLRKVFEPRKEKVVGDWRTLHSEELHDGYCSPDIT